MHRWGNRGREFPRVTREISNRDRVGALSSGQDLSHFPPRRGLCHWQAQACEFLGAGHPLLLWGEE